MPRHRPFHKRYHADFIHSVKAAGMTLEEIGAYDLILEHLNDRDAPLPDDDRFLAGLLGCPLQRWRKIKARLLRLGKVVPTGDNHLTNPRFEREHAERHLLAAEAAAHGREGGRRSAQMRAAQSELPLDEPRTRARTEEPKIATKSQDSSKKVARKLEVNSGKSDLTPSKTAENAEGTLKPRARATQSLRDSDRDSTPTIESLPRANLEELFTAVCDAAGFRPIDPGAIDRAYRQVQAWVAEEVDFEAVVLPTIRQAMANSTDPTRTLGRFRAAIAHEHAKQKAKAGLRQRYKPPEQPVLERKDEDPEMANLRSILCQVVGPERFAMAFNRLRMERHEDELRLSPDWWARSVLESRTGPTITAVARRHGFERVSAC